MSVVIVITSLVLRSYLIKLNKTKHELQFSEQASEDRLRSIDDVGDKHPGMFCVSDLKIQ